MKPFLLSSALAVGVLFLASSAPAQGTHLPVLFDPAGGEPSVALAETPAPNALRSRRVQVHAELFAESAANRPEHIRLPVFADRDYIGRIIEAQRLSDSVMSWRGTLEGYVNGYFSVVCTAGRMSVHVSDGRGGDFHLRPESDGGHLLVQTPPGEQGTCGTCGTIAPPLLAPQNSLNGAPPPPPPDPMANETFVDVLVLYTPNARVAAGGADAIQSKAYHFILDSNWRHGRSNTHVKYRLIGWEEINYDDSSQDLTRHVINMNSTQYPNESIMHEVAARRDAAGADFVVMLTNGRANSGDILGVSLGWPCVVEWTQDTLIFTHELGHSMGCHHEINAPDHPPTGNYSLAYGHTETWNVVLDTVSEKRVTVMYSGFNNQTRTDYFSNPDINFTYTGGDCGGFGDGACLDVVHALGVANSVDNARFLRENRAKSAQLKAPKFYMVAEAQGGDGSNLSPANSLAAIYDQWFPATEALPTDSTLIRMAEGSYPAPIHITKSSRIEKWLGNGIVRIGR